LDFDDAHTDQVPQARESVQDNVIGLNVERLARNERLARGFRDEYVLLRRNELAPGSNEHFAIIISWGDLRGGDHQVSRICCATSTERA
jgi:hypothetical protein